MYCLDLITGEMLFWEDSEKALAVAEFEKQAIECVLWHDDEAVHEKYHIPGDEQIHLESVVCEPDPQYVML